MAANMVITNGSGSRKMSSNGHKFSTLSNSRRMDVSDLTFALPERTLAIIIFLSSSLDFMISSKIGKETYNKEVSEAAGKNLEAKEGI